MKKRVFIGILLLSIFLISCGEQQESVQPTCNKSYILVGTECCLDKDDNSICDKDEVVEEIKTVPVAESKEEVELPKEVLEEVKFIEKTNELPKTNFSISDLQDFLQNISGPYYPFYIANKNYEYSSKIIREVLEKKHLIYFNNKWLIYKINIVNDNLLTIEDFIEFVKYPNWQIWRFYLSEPDWSLLMRTDPLSEKQLKKILPGYYYDNYLKETIFTDLIIKETMLNTPKGNKAIKFEITAPTYDQYRTSTDVWTYVLVYKIPCTNDIMIYYDTDDVTEEKKILQKMDKVLDYCGVDTQIFDSIKFKRYIYKTKKAFNWKIFFRQAYNYTFDANVTVKSEKVKDVTFTFTNYEDPDIMDIWGKYWFALKIIINDSGSEKEYWDGDFQLTGFKNGEEYTKFLRPREVVAHKGSSVIFMPYWGWEELSEPERFYIGPPIVMKIN